ncbi:glycosyltransferase family 4 protein [Hymenobacter terrestris]|uniref:Glycosyltransferase family 4 protein n=1 Tax=Hymenobacter terrestris TaxID=2748310 RepID=A0ABX2Q758_9BACT|nr:glycosyltransferase family 4 protein [Hymenobacter terrestris]NVO86100.1 glycosyltransferase family 4 protein [Hymenobacter terrestris]
MRIVLLALHFAEYSSSLAIALAATHDVLLILSEPNFNNELGIEFKFTKTESLSVILLPHRRSINTLIKNIFRLHKAIKDFNPDLIHCQEVEKDYLIATLPFFRGVPFVLTIHDPVTHSGNDTIQRSVRLRLYTWLLRLHADVAIVHGHAMQVLAENASPWLKGRVKSIPHGPLGQLFNIPFTVDWKSGCCLFFGRIEAYKGLTYFIEAIRSLRSSGVGIYGVIAGRGPDLESFKDIILSDDSFVLKECYLSPSEVIDCFRNANIVVLPYTDATQSGVAAYALGMGRPVVSSKVGSLPELVSDNETGLLVPPRDVTALANALKYLIENPEHSLRMAINANNLANGTLSWSEIACQTEEVYINLLSKQNLDA